MGLLSKLISPPFSGDGSNVEKYSEGNSNSDDSSSNTSSTVDYYNCPICGGDGRGGGRASYETVGGACYNCNGTGHVD